MSRIPSASQTVGPFFNFALTTNPNLGILAGAGVPGERIRLEIPRDRWRWSAGARAIACSSCGRPIQQAATRRHPPISQASAGWRPTRTAAAPSRPSSPAGSPGPMAACRLRTSTSSSSRAACCKHLHTRVYFAGEPANVEDPVLALVPEERRGTLLAQPVEGEPGTWRFDIRLQGDGETVFFDV